MSNIYSTGLFVLASTLLAPGLAAAQPLPPPESVSLDKLGYMSTFPPTGDQLIDQSNRTRYPQTRWVFQHTRELVPTRNIRRGLMPPSKLAVEEKNLDDFKFEDDKGQLITITQWQQATYTDALIVMHKGRIVYERYLNQMKPDTLTCCSR